ncbi:TRAP transporter substrate-binding protein [Bosea sp. 124]|uniref:TRAP transporter substrate-binding protein n=1 Tax=Bosea sp. 124 TaxID=2135642 RepID=UPI000D3B4295|nr:TRAP transporter substrate-binding protein [Bosea sp. 124]PTM40977.1 tripartite ATP-independent transporter DctP family solute receptor [Bosea sp. 124]
MTTKFISNPSRRAVLGAAAAAAGTIAMPSVLRAQQIEWIGASATPPTDFIALSLDVFAARVKALTKGQINITAHHAGALGGERENVEGLLQGAIHVATPGAAILGGWYKPAEVWTYPYLFKDVAHKDKVMTAIMVEYGDEVGKQAKLRPVGAIPRMPRTLSSNRVVKTPADLKGLKIRVPETTMWRRTFERFGASPTPLAFPEVFQALKSGVIEGQENPMALTYNSGIFDVNRNLALTEHMMQDNMMVLSEASFRGLTEEQRKLVVQAAREMEDDLRPKVIADDNRILELVKAKKIAINEVDKDAFRKSLEGMEAEFAHVKGWIEKIRGIA